MCIEKYQGKVQAVEYIYILTLDLDTLHEARVGELETAGPPLAPLQHRGGTAATRNTEYGGRLNTSFLLAFVGT